MLNFALLLLSLAAGIYLLIKAQKEFLGKIFSGLIWLQILLSLAGIGAMGFKAVKMMRHHGCEEKRECRMEKEIMIKDDGMGHCSMDSTATCSMHGCTMEGDSVVMEKEMCEKMMGKEACDAMCKDRGRCIMSKDECMQMCHTSGKPCCADKASAEGAKKCQGEKKECCKHKM